VELERTRGRLGVSAPEGVEQRPMLSRCGLAGEVQPIVMADEGLDRRDMA
jgi:hypothetical protein